jgi:hypothetical protein
VATWWCHTEHSRGNVFKNCLHWKAQQKVLWAKVREETGRGKDRFTIRDLLADAGCSRAVLDFLATSIRMVAQD